MTDLYILVNPNRAGGEVYLAIYLIEMLVTKKFCRSLDDNWWSRDKSQATRYPKHEARNILRLNPTWLCEYAGTKW